MAPVYDLVCTNKECKHVEENVYTTADKINAGEEVCPVCGSPLKIEYNTFRHTLIDAG